MAVLTDELIAALLSDDSIEVKSVEGDFDEAKHPRDAHGRFATIGSLVRIVGTNNKATIVGHNDNGTIQVRNPGGGTFAVDPKKTTVVTQKVNRSSDAALRHMSGLKGDATPENLLAHKPEPGEQTRATSEMMRRARTAIPAAKPVADARAVEAGEKPSGSSVIKLTGPGSVQRASRRRSTVDDEDERHPDAPLSDAERATEAAQDAETARRIAAQTPDLRDDGKAFGTGYADSSDPRNAPAYDKYVQATDKKLDAAFAGAGDTAKMFKDATGQWSPDRAALHEQILGDLMDQYKDVPREKKAVVLAGPSGAGKSTAIKQFGAQFGIEGDARGNPKNYATINADEMKSELIKRGAVPDVYTSKYGLAPEETAMLTHEESSHLAKRLQARLMDTGTNSVLDGTFSGDFGKKVTQVNTFKSQGYSVTGVLVDGDIPTSFRNAGRRHMGRMGADGKKHAEDPADLKPGETLGGRYVPYSLIEAQKPTGHKSDLFGRLHKSQNAENFEKAIPAFDGGVMIFDNSTNPPSVAYRKPGSTVKAEGQAAGTVADVSATKHEIESRGPDERLASRYPLKDEPVTPERQASRDARAATMQATQDAREAELRKRDEDEASGKIPKYTPPSDRPRARRQNRDNYGVAVRRVR